MTEDDQEFTYTDLVISLGDDLERSFPEDGTVHDLDDLVEEAIERALRRFRNRTGEEPSAIFQHFPETLHYDLEAPDDGSDEPKTAAEGLTLMAANLLRASMSNRRFEMLRDSLGDGVGLAISSCLQFVDELDKKRALDHDDRGVVKSVRGDYVMEGKLSRGFHTVIALARQHSLTTVEDNPVIDRIDLPYYDLEPQEALYTIHDAASKIAWMCDLNPERFASLARETWYDPGKQATASHP